MSGDVLELGWAELACMAMCQIIRCMNYISRTFNVTFSDKQTGMGINASLHHRMQLQLHLRDVCILNMEDMHQCAIHSVENLLISP